jgi:putative oxidoreductase
MQNFTQDPMALFLGLVIARMTFGLLMAAHGAQKLFGWFGGHGLAGTGGFMESLGFRPGRRFAALAGGAEVTGGILTALGLLGPVGPALMIAVMVVAMGSVHWPNGLFAAKNGVELPLLFAAAAVAFAVIGPGPYSLDAAFGLEGIWTPALRIAVPTVGLLGGLASLALRHPAQAASQR